MVAKESFLGRGYIICKGFVVGSEECLVIEEGLLIDLEYIEELGGI